MLSVLPQKSDDQVTEALRLHAHVEKLSLVVFATAAKSVDIIQAQIVSLTSIMHLQLHLEVTVVALVSMGDMSQDSAG